MMTKEEYANLVHELNTQDNRMTANPIFVVQEEEMILGFHRDYTDDAAWVDMDSGEFFIHTERDEVVAELISDGFPYEGKTPGEITDEMIEQSGYVSMGYNKRWKHISAHLTEKAANRYIEANGHRHSGDLRVYVDSQYRCHEFNAVVEALRSGQLILTD
jgi:hypothetical protein